MEQPGLFLDLAIALTIALLGGLLAHQARQPPMLGYILGGALVGPFGFGLIQEPSQVRFLATVGLVLLLFALGVQFSLEEIFRHGKIALGGGLLQILLTLLWGLLIASWLGWGAGEGFAFGAMIALSSTMVLLKTLSDRGELESLHGRVMTGILIVQDLAAVPLMVLLPTLSHLEQGAFWEPAAAVGKGILVLGVVVVLGPRLLPRFMGWIVALRSRELFILTIIALSLGAALLTSLMGLSLALGAFMAGLLVSESDYNRQVLADVLPLRETFASIFFVSLGMLADPRFMIAYWPQVLVVLGAVVLGKALICTTIAWLFRYRGPTAFAVGLGLVQIGEFSFVLAGVALESGLIGEHLFSLVLTTAILTILLTPFALDLARPLQARLQRSAPGFLQSLVRGSEQLPQGPPGLRGHMVLCGYGRVSRALVWALERRNFSYFVIDLDPHVVAELRRRGVPALYGDSSNAAVLSQAGLEHARVLAVSLNDPVATELTIRRAREINRRLDVVARAHSHAEAEMLRHLGVGEVVIPEFEASLEMLRHALHRFGLSAVEIQHFISAIRQENAPPPAEET